MVNFGIGDSYSNTILPAKIRAYVDLTKPASSVGIMLAVPFTALLYGGLYSSVTATAFVTQNWATVTLVSLSALLLHGSSQSMNMAEDAHIDKQTDHKGNRPIPSGVVTQEEARALSWVGILSGVGIASTITQGFTIYAIILAFFGVFYNLEPFRVKELLWTNLIWQAVSRGLLLYPAMFAVWGEPWNPVGWSMGIASFFLVLSMQNSADFADVEIDEEFGIITPAVHHGLKALTKIMTAIAVVMFGFITLAIYMSWIPNFWSLYVLALPVGWSLYSLWTEPGSISDIGENHSTWYVFYICLAGMYVLPALQVIIF